MVKYKLLEITEHQIFFGPVTMLMGALHAHYKTDTYFGDSMRLDRFLFILNVYHWLALIATLV